MMAEKILKSDNHDSKLDAERKDWMASESYFARSWTHVFFNWKHHRIMMGQTMLDILSSQKQKAWRVLDLGCGSGAITFTAVDICEGIHGVRWYGLDLNIAAVARAARSSRFREAERNKPPTHFLSANLYSLPFGRNSFDMVLCSEVLEHIANPPEAIAELARILKPGGYAMITTPNPDNLVEKTGYAIDKVTRGSLKRTFWAGCDNISAPPLTAAAGLAHVSIHPYKVWQAWLRDAGLQVVRKVRGPMLFGGPFFDRHPFISGVLIALDPILDRLPLRFLLSSNLGMLCCKR